MTVMRYVEPVERSRWVQANKLGIFTLKCLGTRFCTLKGLFWYLQSLI
jgi:hypothetical protein